jgi:hypothetical protein
MPDSNNTAIVSVIAISSGLKMNMFMRRLMITPTKYALMLSTMPKYADCEMNSLIFSVGFSV